MRALPLLITFSPLVILSSLALYDPNLHAPSLTDFQYKQRGQRVLLRNAKIIPQHGISPHTEPSNVENNIIFSFMIFYD